MHRHLEVRIRGHRSYQPKTGIAAVPIPRLTLFKKNELCFCCKVVVINPPRRPEQESLHNLLKQYGMRSLIFRRRMLRRIYGQISAYTDPV